MIDRPEKMIDKYVKAGADIITIHYESFDVQEQLIKTLKKIKSKGKMVGLAIDLETNIEVVDPLLKFVDMVLIMTVKAGKGGQEFNKNALKKKIATVMNEV